MVKEPQNVITIDGNGISDIGQSIATGGNGIQDIR